MSDPNNEQNRTVLVVSSDGLARESIWPTSWALSLGQAGLVVTGRWSRGASEAPPLDGIRGIVTDLVGEPLRALLETAGEAGVPTLLVRALPGTTPELESLAKTAHLAPVVAGLHLRAHPAFLRVVAAVQSAEIGLLRAVATDLVVASDSHSTDLRDLLAQPLDLIRQVTGQASVRLQAYRAPTQQNDGESWAILGQTERAVVVSAHIAQVACGTSASRVEVNRIRVVGTHGWVLVDLLHPSLTVTSVAGVHDVSIGDSTVVELARTFASVLDGSSGGTSLHDSAVLSKVIDGIADSAEALQERVVQW